MSPNLAWETVPGSALEALLPDLRQQLQDGLPDGTRIQRLRLSCTPGHSLLRLLIPWGEWRRESFAFHAPGQLYPLDWTGDTLRAFQEVALEVETSEQAQEALRFHVWAVAIDPQVPSLAGHRRWVVERWDELALRDGASLDPRVEAAARGLIRPMIPLPAMDAQHPGAFHFGCAVAGGEGVEWVEFRVSPRGVERLNPEVTEVIPLPLVTWTARSDRQVVLVREVAFTAERFLRHIEAGRPLNQARVTEAVRARGRVFPAPVVVSQVHFQADVDLEGAVFEGGLELDRCVIQGRLKLKDARVTGTLDCSGLRFEAPDAASDEVDDPWAVYDLDASGIETTGSVVLQGIRTRRPVSLSHSRIEEDLRMGGAEVGPPRFPSLQPEGRTALNLAVARIGGDLDLIRAPTRLARPPEPDARAMDGRVPGFSSATTLLRGSLVARRITVGGGVALGGVRCDGHVDPQHADLQAGLDGEALDRDVRFIVLGGISLHSARAGGLIVLGGVWVGEGLAFTAAQTREIFVRTRVGPGGRIRPATVQGELTLSGLHCGDLEFEGSNLGPVVMATGSMGRILLNAGLEPVDEGDPSGPVQVRPCVVSSLFMGDVSIGKGVRLLGLRVGNDVADGREPGGESGYIRFLNVQCGGDVRLSDGRGPNFTEAPGAPEGWALGRPPQAAELRTVVAGDVRARGLHAEGSIAACNMEVRGRLALRNCGCDQDLEMGAVGGDGEGEERRTLTSCAFLDLEMTRCGGDADLSGIVVAGNGGASGVLGRRLVVEGRLAFSSPRGGWSGEDGISSDPAQRYDAVIEGALDLSVAEAAHLVVSGSSFQEGHPGVGITLERGRFRRLQVVEPWPFRHDLSDTQVERWQIPTEHLLTFLERSHPFRRSSYIEIERVLRNEAQEAEADRVYRGMRRRAIREEEADGKGRGWWSRDPFGTLARTWGSRALGWVYGWGTLYWLPMIFVALPTFLFSVGLFSNPRNVEAIPTAVLARGLTVSAEPVRPAGMGESWGVFDGMWMAIRFHVPVVPLAARGSWEPTRSQAELRLPDRGVELPFSAEGYAFAIYLLHWIVWPLFLYGVGRKVLRDRA